jgi:prepilin-type processing-associated H-X9-DG protein
MRKQAFTGLELGAMILLLVAFAAMALPALSRARDERLRAACQQNLKQWGQVLNMYVDEQNGWYPSRYVDYSVPPSEAAIESGLDGTLLYPDYIGANANPSLGIAVCPDDPTHSGLARSRNHGDLFGPVHSAWHYPDSPVEQQSQYLQLPLRSYTYQGYEMSYQDIWEEEDLVRIADALRRDAGQWPSRLETQIKVTLPKRIQELNRFRTGLSCVPMTDLNEMPPEGFEASKAVMWETGGSLGKDDVANPNSFRHTGGKNVLFLDGHVEFQQYPGKPGKMSWLVSPEALSASASTSNGFP